MSKVVRSIVITGNGTNCEMEMAHACRLAGSEVVDIVHISELLYGEKSLDDYDSSIYPAGFSTATTWVPPKPGPTASSMPPSKAIRKNSESSSTGSSGRGKLILGVCNGFQLMVKLGILPNFDGKPFAQSVTLTHNDSGRFEDRWAYLKVNPDSPCVFTKSLPVCTTPSATARENSWLTVT